MSNPIIESHKFSLRESASHNCSNRAYSLNSHSSNGIRPNPKMRTADKLKASPVKSTFRTLSNF